MRDPAASINWRLLLSSSGDAACNLAFEEVLFEELPADAACLLIYRDEPCVVSGRFQNPWIEADQDWLAQEGIPFRRRMSGGGTVWHDPGNWNFCFISRDPAEAQARNHALMLSCLGSLGMDLELNARGDLLCAGRKVSGNALVKRQGKILHHASLLVHADLENLRRALRKTLPSAWAYRSGAVPSQPSPVCNLIDRYPGLSAEACWEAVVAWSAAALACRPETVDPLAHPKTAVLAERNRSWEWNFGRTPDFVIDRGGAGSLEIRSGRLGVNAFPGFDTLARMERVGLNGAQAQGAQHE